MKRSLLLALLLLAAPAWGGITDNGDGTSTFWFCSTDANVATLQTALEALSEDEERASIYALSSLLLLDAVEVTVGNDVIDTTYCGVLVTGKSEWRVTASNAIAGPWRTAVTNQLGYLDVEPADGVDDSTGETRNQMLDRSLKQGLKAFVQGRYVQDAPAPSVADDFDDSPTL